MAKAKEDKAEKTDKNGNASVANIVKKYGDIMTSGTGLLDKKIQVFPVSPSIDFVLGGGIPEGSFVSISGPPGCGKSTTTLQIIANAQKPEFYVNGKPRKIFYADVEHRLKPMNMTGIVGLDPAGITVIKSTKESILSSQEFLDIIEAIVKDPENEGCLVVIDSSSALCPADEQTAETSGSLRSTQPKIMAHWCRKMAAPVKVMSATVIMIQHLITNTSGYGEKWQVDGGEKLKFQLDVNITTRNKPEQWLEEGTIVGQIVTWKVIKSAMGASGNECESCLRYGKGLDSIKETFLIAVDLGLIDKAGAWFSFEMNGATVKTQGEAKMCELFAEKPDVYEFIRTKLYTFIKAEE